MIEKAEFESEMENEMEVALERAHRNPVLMPDFYRKFLSGEVILIPKNLPEDNDSPPPPLSHLKFGRILHEGNYYVPIFSSVDALQDYIKRDCRCVQVSTDMALETLHDTGIWLNPGSKINMYFSQEEVARFLAHQRQTQVTRLTVASGQEIFLGEPSKFPTELVKALAEFYKRRPNVKKAYLAQYFIPKKNEKPGLLISLALKNPDASIIEESGAIAKKHLPEDSRLDFVLAGTENLDSYFNSKNPFYSQTWLKTLGFY